MEVVITTGAIKRANLQSKCHHQQTNTQFFFTDQMSLSTEGKTNGLASCQTEMSKLYLDLRSDFQTKGEFISTTKDKTKLLLVLQKLCKLDLRPRFHLRTKTDFFLLKSPTECLCSH